MRSANLALSVVAARRTSTTASLAFDDADMGRFIVVVAMLGCSHWSRKDTALEASFAIVTTIDWAQTAEVTAACSETNPILGWCGQRMPVGVYFPVALAVHAAVSALLPPTARTIFQAASTGMETNTALWNARVR
jgi:hypothetical protein